MRSFDRLEYRRRPSSWAALLRAMAKPRQGDADAPLPALGARWQAHPAGAHGLRDFLRLTGLPEEAHLPSLYLHVLNFPLQFAVLTHPAFPIPIWSIVQVRNHLLQHRGVRQGELIEQEARIVAHRHLERATEVDVHTTVRSGAELAWESLNTYYFRGRRGPAADPSPLAKAPETGGSLHARWQTPSGAGLRFARLTGDFNPLHYWPGYARRQGYRGAFHHAQALLGACLARLPAPPAESPQRLDAWLKGPVFRGAEVALHARVEPSQTAFALYMEGEPRPAVQARVAAVPVGSALLDAHGQPLALPPAPAGPRAARPPPL